MFSTDFIFRQQENLVDNQKCWAGFRPLCNKILLKLHGFMKYIYIHILPSLIKDKQIFQNTPSLKFSGLLTAAHPQKVSKKRGL